MLSWSLGAGTLRSTIPPTPWIDNGEHQQHRGIYFAKYYGGGGGVKWLLGGKMKTEGVGGKKKKKRKGEKEKGEKRLKNGLKTHL